jgi:hypothetical protein
MNTYGLLKAIAEGKLSESRPLEREDVCIESVIINKQRPEKSVVKLKFGYNNSFFQIFGKKSNEWEVSFAYGVYYREDHDWESYDWDQFEEVFKDGSYFRENEFTEEQKETFKLIITMLSPNLINDPFSIENTIKLSEIIYKLYQDIVENFYDREVEIRNNCEIQTLKKSMVKNESNVLFKYGIYAKTPFVDYFTNVDTLISLYDKTNKQDDDIIDMLSQIVYDDSNIDRLSYEEYKYEYDCLGEFWDKESYSYALSRLLDDVYDKVEQEFESDDKRKEYIKFFGFISSKYNIGKWHSRKGKGTVGGFNAIKIMDIDKESLDLIVQVGKKVPGYHTAVKNVKMDYDQFLNFLNQPSLFDESFGKKKTIL